MQKWITKPRIKLAEQFGGFYATPYPPGVNLEDSSDDPDPAKERYAFYVTTIHGQKTYIQSGDFIVQEPDGVHYYPCKPEIWLAGHDKLESEK